jgi:hypothetical protein
MVILSILYPLIPDWHNRPNDAVYSPIAILLSPWYSTSSDVLNTSPLSICFLPTFPSELGEPMILP